MRLTIEQARDLLEEVGELRRADAEYLDGMDLPGPLILGLPRAEHLAELSETMFPPDGEPEPEAPRDATLEEFLRDPRPRAGVNSRANRSDTYKAVFMVAAIPGARPSTGLMFNPGSAVKLHHYSPMNAPYAYVCPEGLAKYAIPLSGALYNRADGTRAAPAAPGQPKVGPGDGDDLIRRLAVARMGRELGGTAFAGCGSPVVDGALRRAFGGMLSGPPPEDIYGWLNLWEGEALTPADVPRTVARSVLPLARARPEGDGVEIQVRWSESCTYRLYETQYYRADIEVPEEVLAEGEDAVRDYIHDRISDGGWDCYDSEEADREYVDSEGAEDVEFDAEDEIEAAQLRQGE